MRLCLAVAAFAAVLVPSVSLAATSRVCGGIDLLSPASGHHFIGTRPIHFSWSGEPAGTVSRELHLATLDGSEVVIPLDGRFSDTVRVRMTGDLGWAVVFKDASGKVLCTSPAGLLAEGSGGKLAFSNESLSGQSSGPGAPVKVSVYVHNGRLVIVLQNSPYTGAYTKLIASDNYDGTFEDLMGASGLEIHGNNLANGTLANRLTGSAGNDLIYLYGGDDLAEGGAGDDILVGGDGNDTLSDVLPATVDDTDSLYGGPGVDYLDVGDTDTLDVIHISVDGLDGGALNPGDTVSFGPDEP